MAIKLTKSCCSFCISPRIELAIWACISLSITTVSLFYLIFGVLFADVMRGGSHRYAPEDLIILVISLVLIADVVYNVLILGSSLGGNAKLLNISYYLGAVLWFVLTVILILGFATAIAIGPSDAAALFYRYSAIFILLIIMRGYMLLIMCGVRSQLQEHGYIDLDKTMEIGRDQEPPVGLVH
ncbi:uncharacterized protein LOC134671117 [Cydia fagiglandana]|uniref:uncharacterized protein LOC134671117 n=1 Tax=Cydia fagiglandana TaxID=1458189 RepID=UPI002FEDED83